MQIPETAEQYTALPEDVRDEVADALSCEIYYCPECDEEGRKDHTQCPRFPREHDATGYMGTGTEHPEEWRGLARAIAAD